MPEPTPEDDFSGQLRIRCDYETYLAFWTFAENYYTYEAALADLLRAADENPHVTRAGPVDLGMAREDYSGPSGWG